MKNLGKILFPIDFSESTRAMAPFVERTAALFGASVTLVHVIDPRSLSLSEDLELAIRPLESVLDDHRTAQTSRLHDYERFSDAERVVLDGDAATEITTFARFQRFDLIVMPTHSGRFAQRLLGSTTAHVINRSECPVLTSRHAETAHAAPVDHKRWLCALDSTEYGNALLERANALSMQATAELSWIHIVDSKHGNADSADWLNLVEDASKQIKSMSDRGGLTKRGEILIGPIRETLVQAISTRQADLLIIGRSNDDPSSGRMSDFTYAMVRDSQVPVLTV